MAAARIIHHLADALIESARSKGVAPEDILPDHEPNISTYWEGDDLLHILKGVGRHLQDEFYGLAAYKCPPGTSQLGIEILITSETLRDAISRCCRFYALVTKGVEFRFSETDDVATIEFRLADPELDRRNFLTEWQAARWFRLSQWLVGEEIPLLGVDFAHAPNAPVSEYVEIFGIECAFRRPTSRICFPSGYLSRRVIRRLPDLETTRASSRYNPIPDGSVQENWREAVRIILRMRLARTSALPTLEELAAEFHICGQTLRRRLRNEKSSYRLLKAEIRREVALDSIRDRRMPLSQISLMAGFAETKGLVRAVKAWTGLTPSQYRKTTVGTPGEPDTLSIGDGASDQGRASAA